MSNLTKKCEQECTVRNGFGAIKLIIEAVDRDLGGFSVRRALPTHHRRMVGPWIFFDHIGPARLSAGDGVKVRPHPHIGLATVTYLFEGEISHRDSLGSFQVIRPGDINLMVTGRGMVHSERESPEISSVERKLHGLQLWLALPAEFEETEPAFYHYPNNQIPQVNVEDVSVRVMVGSAYGVSSPVKTYSETLYMEAHIKLGQRLSLPPAAERAIYIASGELKAGDTLIREHNMALLAEDEVVLEASKDTRLVLIGGESVGPRFIEWNFVSSRQERIERAKQDWLARRFAKVPGDEEEYIPLPR